MEVRYQIFPEEGLLIQQYLSDWNLNTYVEYFSEVMSHPDYHKVTKVFSDVTSIDLLTPYKELQQLIDFRQNRIRSKYFNVHLISNSTNTAFVLLYQQQLKEKGYDYEYCSTLEKAMMLLNLPFTLHEMEHRLENLEERFVRNLNSNAS